MDSRITMENYIQRQINQSPKKIERILERTKTENRHRYIFNEITEIIDNYINGNISQRFLVLPGIRGTGKTTILHQTYEYLTKTKNINPNRVFLINTELLTSYANLNLNSIIHFFIEEYHDGHIVLEEPVFILVDETQYDKDWEKTAKLIYNENPDVFMIFTGSSALELEISADSARRRDKIPVNPLNFQEYLELKYGLKTPHNIQKSLIELILNGDEESIKKAQQLESKIYEKFTTLEKSIDKEWEHYLKYGGLPYEFDLEDYFAEARTIELITRVIKADIDPIHSTQYNSKLIAPHLLRIIASQRPGELSQNKIRDTINQSTHTKSGTGTISQILETFEKTRLLFHIEAYGGGSKSIRKPWQYYFIQPCIKHALWSSGGIDIHNKQQLLGILSENLVASLLYRLNDRRKRFELYYPPGKGEADFILNTYNKLIPIEVGIGKKQLKQVKKTNKNYNCKYGILISNRTERITKEEDVICIPLKTFSFI